MDQRRFAQRRAQFLEELEDGVAVVPAAVETLRNGDTAHPFRQDSDFFFLTGFPEPDAVAILDPTSATPYTLLVRPRDPEQEAWTGRRAGVEGARERYGADAAFPLADLDRVLRDHLLGKGALWYRLGNPRLDDRILRLLAAARTHRVRSGAVVPDRVVDPLPTLADLRLVKTEAELGALRTAAAISAAAHAEAMRHTRPGLAEHQVQAVLEYVFRAHGAPREAYPSIVASGENAVVLHYVANDRVMQAGDLLLVDAAAEYEHLAADITRTFPVDGRFRPEQRALYDAVLGAQEAVLAACGPGRTFADLHRIAVRTLTEALVDLGLLPPPIDDAVAYRWYREFFFHGTGHWLGLDVHDAGAYRVDGRSRPLVPGMTFTVEPGLYVAPTKIRLELPHAVYDEAEVREVTWREGAEEARRLQRRRREEARTTAHEVPAAFAGIGVRIEDDVVITATGHENLTRAVPVDPDAIEVLCAEAPRVPPVS